MTKETIKEILNLAVNASSGHNSQPWKFIVKGENVFILNIPEKDKTLFNYKQRGSLIAHGALIENIIILASEKGYWANVILFPEEKEPDLTALINFRKDGNNYAYRRLSSFVSERATNRKPYKKIHLKPTGEERLKEFFEAVKKTGFEIALIQNETDIRRLAKTLSMADKLLFENYYIHKALFENVNWTLKEEQKRREGLYVGTKELSFLERIIFKYLLSRWNIVNGLNKIGLSTKAALKRQKLYEQCSAIGLIFAPNDSSRDFIEAGRILQRFWLTVSSLGLSFQPVSVGLLYLGQMARAESPNEFTPNQIEFIKEAYQDIINIFNVFKKTPVFSFRIGYANPPTAVSLKKPPEIIYED